MSTVVSYFVRESKDSAGVRMDTLIGTWHFKIRDGLVHGTVFVA